MAASSPGAPSTGTCAVTVPHPVPSSLPWRQGLFGYGEAYGDDHLWVGALGPGGVYDADSSFVDSTGAIGLKLPWWRITPGELTITGRRLDAAAPPLRSRIAEGYGDRGFQSTGVYFPTPGCWEVTGHVGDATLTFVMLVRLRD